MTPREIAAAGMATTRSVNRWIEQFNQDESRDIPKGIDLEVEDPDLLDFIRTRIEKSKGPEAAAKIVPESPKTERFISRGIVKEAPAAKTPIQDAIKKSEALPPKVEKRVLLNGGGRGSGRTEANRKFFDSGAPSDPLFPLTGIDNPEWKGRASKGISAMVAEAEKEEEAKKVDRASLDPSWTFRRILSVLPLPMLGLAASYGVYHFAANFAPDWVAIAEASAFELTYIGLAALEGLSKEQKGRAGFVARGAVAVSIIYNSIAGALYLDPQLFENLGRFAFWSVSILHGVPLAVLAYLVADLVLHSEQD